MACHGQYQHRAAHTLGNHTCEIDGAAAHCETCRTFHAGNGHEPYAIEAIGRCRDRLERRGGQSKIAARICVANGFAGPHDPEGLRLDGVFMPATPARSDPWYMRPPTVDPARINNAVFTP